MMSRLTSWCFWESTSRRQYAHMHQATDCGKCSSLGCDKCGKSQYSGMVAATPQRARYLQCKPTLVVHPTWKTLNNMPMDCVLQHVYSSGVLRKSLDKFSNGLIMMLLHSHIFISISYLHKLHKQHAQCFCAPSKCTSLGYTTPTLWVALTRVYQKHMNK